MLLWWGHLAHDAVDDRLAEEVCRRVYGGMGLDLRAALASAAAMLELEGGSVAGWAEASAAPARDLLGRRLAPFVSWNLAGDHQAVDRSVLDGTVIPVSRQASSFSSRLRLTDHGPGSRREVHLPIAVYWSLHPCCCSHQSAPPAGAEGADLCRRAVRTAENR